MAKWTVGFGVALVLISVGFWLGMGRAETAALHPAGIGVLLVVCGLLADTEDAKKRMLWMHIAVTLGLIAFLTTGVRVVIALVKGTAGVNPLGFDERAVIAVVSLVYVGLCVRSFVAARRARLAEVGRQRRS
jgi:hypothetical protein